MKKFSLILILILTVQITIAQEKYAVIINASSPGVPGSYDAMDSTNSWKLGNKSTEPYWEFWNDIYLMWELLYERGFDDDNIFVLYNEGDDFEYQDYNIRYTAQHHGLTKITDFRAWQTAVDSVFSGLSYGINGLTQITEDDFLVLYTFGHGSTSGVGLLPIPPESRESLTWEDLSDKLSNLNCYKKLIIMQQCFSGSSIPFLEDTNTIIMTAANDSMIAWGCDSVYFDAIDYPGDTIPGNEYIAYERELYPGDTFSYRHGEFNLHMFNAIRGMEPGNQYDYYQTEYQDFPLSEADTNNDNYTSISETFTWTRNFDSRMRYMEYLYTNDEEHWDDPQLSDISNISAYTSIEYPTLLHTNIDSNQLHRGLIGVSKTIHITSGNQLTLKSNAKVELVNNSDIVVDNGAILVIGDDAVFNGSFNKIIVEGDIQIGHNVTFNSTIIELNNYNLQTVFDTILFNQSELINYGNSLTVSNSVFSDTSNASSYIGDVIITNTSFSDSWVYMENQEYETNYTATITNCNFTSDLAVGAIDIWNYNNFFVSENSINGYYNGIQLMQSGEGTSGNQTIFNNEITNSTSAGIISFNSTSSIAGNYIHNNYCGIRLYNNSNTDIVGNPGATTYAETQQVIDNDGYELYFSPASFPWYIRHNVIIDEDNAGNPTDPMVYYSGTGGFFLKDVRYNCWGNNFDPQDDLYPTGYMVDPIWYPGGGGIVQEAAESLYLSGKTEYDSAYYTSAKSTFEMVISQYPETEYASASMKDLFTLEEFVTNDYNTLQHYYSANTVIQNDSILTELSVFLANKCDVKLENWQPAITHYEDIINNPQTPDDSIFAIIDLGHTYFLMANSGNGRSVIMGNLTEHIPTSKEEFFKKRDYLLSLLPINRNTEYIYNETEGSKLLHNVPNPFSKNTTIYYQLTEKTGGSIKVINTAGEIVQNINISNESGLHYINLDMSNLPSGIYYYSMVINGKRTDTKRMVLVK